MFDRLEDWQNKAKSLSEKDAAIDRIIKIIHIMNNGAL